jgi:hypothetical protein
MHFIAASSSTNVLRIINHTIISYFKVMKILIFFYNCNYYHVSQIIINYKIQQYRQAVLVKTYTLHYI